MAKIDTFSPAIWRFRQKLWYRVVVAVCNFFANLPILSLWCVGDRVVTYSQRRAVSSHQRGLLTGPARTTGPSHLATPTGSYWHLWTDKYFTFVSESDEPALLDLEPEMWREILPQLFWVCWSSVYHSVATSWQASRHSVLICFFYYYYYYTCISVLRLRTHWLVFLSALTVSCCSLFGVLSL